MLMFSKNSCLGCDKHLSLMLMLILKFFFIYLLKEGDRSLQCHSTAELVTEIIYGRVTIWSCNIIAIVLGFRIEEKEIRKA